MHVCFLYRKNSSNIHKYAACDTDSGDIYICSSDTDTDDADTDTGYTDNSDADSGDIYRIW